MFSFANASQAHPETNGGHGNKRQRTAAMYHRKRAVTACQSCRLRKTKCDNVRPACGFCSSNGAQCIYPSAGAANDYSTYDPASLTILDRLNHVVSLLESRPSAVLVNDTQPLNDTRRISEYSDPSSSHPGQHILNIAPVIPHDATAHIPEADILQALEIPGFPSEKSNCESIMRWPILEGLVPDVHSLVLESEQDTESCRTDPRVERGASLGRGVQEDDFIPLSKRFLAYVHVKNPILDVADYKAKVRDAAENGPRWDGASCLVLISCALACLSAPFQTEGGVNATPESTRSSASACVDQDTASSYFLAAKKRLGLLQPSLLYIQCLFLCGVYEMYALHPLQAWFHFNRACVDLRNLLWARSQGRPGGSHTISRETHRLEQRLYWSCLKSEYELRWEIPLPPSGIMHCDYPDMFPSPPTELTSPTAQNQALDVLQDDIIPEEEKSWFYYLAEISYRRMMNRAMAVMGRHEEQGWTRNIGELIQQCKDFNEHIDIWFSHIPPQIDPKDEGLSNSELAQYARNRAIGCREWIHRPFLYYVIHQPPSAPYYEQAMPLARRCLELSVELLSRTYGHHRHHGTWYVGRACLTKALMFIAAEKSGKIQLPDGWKDALEIARWTLHRWSGEAPDLRWAEAILENVLSNVEGVSL
ncbi:vegetative cell wall gp1 [Fusarium albosuccineum]|uniref:Vegetative cell wall gp1 n=1 Tax=Fusarium albosuccineum TaxID=1237068 RepID=A0A8H4KHH3_9HYPO|nr:vegetative cell wall gp1 [Fusarium albosuccineum]